MKDIAVTVDNKGRLSIPTKVRKKLGINPGDILFFRERDLILEYTKAENPFDILAKHALQEYKDGKTISLEEFEEKMKKRKTTKK